MPEIKITVKNKIATGDGTVIICGNSDYSVKFTFDAEWQSQTTKTMRVIYGDNKYYDVVFTGNTANMPAITNSIGIKIGCYAGNLETSTPAYFDAKKSILCDNPIHTTPPTDVYNQLVSRINDIEDDIEDIEEDKQDKLTAGQNITIVNNVISATGGSGGTSDHTQLTNRDASNQHPIAAITGLQTALDAKADESDIPTKTSDLTNDSGFLTQHQDISGKVDKAEGKGLSTNDYTDAEKSKLSGIEAGAEVNDITDVKINGSSIVTDGVANVPLGSGSNVGVFKISASRGLTALSDGTLSLVSAEPSQVSARNGFLPISGYNLDYAVKAAMCDGRGASWSESEKASARARLGATAHSFEKILDYVVPDGETLGTGVAFSDLVVVQNKVLSELIISIMIPKNSVFTNNNALFSVTNDSKRIGASLSLSVSDSQDCYHQIHFILLPNGFIEYKTTSAGYTYNSPNVVTDMWATASYGDSKNVPSNGLSECFKIIEGYPNGTILPSGTVIKIYGR